MKIRIGIGTGAAGLDGTALARLADDLVDLGFDSLWLPEILTGDGADPLVGLAWAGAHNRRLKLGTTMLLPGRNPVRLAKQVAALDALSDGRFLVTFVPGLAQGPERDAVGVAPAGRGAAFDEVLPLLRRLWAGGRVTHDGPAGRFADVSVSPLPVQDPFDVWLGGLARSTLERCGRLADGWLPALCGPAEAAAGRRVVDEAAEAAGRAISPEHFGMSIGYARTALDDRVAAALSARARGRPLDDLVPVGPDALRDLLHRFIAVGFSKFVLRPLDPPADWREELEHLAAAVGDLQT
ncbi:MAG TPA: LLM class flavin-dependent oxidoreductase [Acidimicrobiales bacterium]|nr:LLM class flavin-dependent oxidoreductase [Acidimicrobiales bacterium]